MGSLDGISVLIRGKRTELAFSLPGEDTARGQLSGSQHLENSTVLAPWSWMNFQTLGLWKNRCLLLSHPACGILLWQLELTKTHIVNTKLLTVRRFCISQKHFKHVTVLVTWILLRITTYLTPKHNICCLTDIYINLSCVHEMKKSITKLTWKPISREGASTIGGSFRHVSGGKTCLVPLRSFMICAPPQHTFSDLTHHFSFLSLVFAFTKLLAIFPISLPARGPLYLLFPLLGIFLLQI